MKIGGVGCGMVGATSAYALVMSGVGREPVHRPMTSAIVGRFNAPTASGWGRPYDDYR